MAASPPDDVFDIALEFTREDEDAGGDNYRVEEYVATGERRMDGYGVSLEPAVEQILTDKNPQVEIGPDMDGIRQELQRMEAALGGSTTPDHVESGGGNPVIVNNRQYQEIQQHADPDEAQVTYSQDPAFHDHSVTSRDEAWKELESFLDSLEDHIAHLEGFPLEQKKDQIRTYFDSALQSNQFVIPVGDEDLVRKGGSLDSSGFLDWDDYPLEFEQKPFGASILYGTETDQITVAAVDPEQTGEPVETGEDPHYELQELADSYQLVADTHGYSGDISASYMEENNVLMLQDGDDEVLGYERLPDADPSTLETTENNGVYQVRIGKDA